MKTQLAAIAHDLLGHQAESIDSMGVDIVLKLIAIPNQWAVISCPEVANKGKNFGAL